MNKIITYFILILVFCSRFSAQFQFPCSSAPLPVNSPLLTQMNMNSRSVPTFTIPVVFHVYYNGQTTQHIPGYTEIQQALDSLNGRYAKLNFDTAFIYSGFKSFAAAAGIEFQLARKDEAGNCISGVMYHYSPSIINTSFAPNLNTNKYLNIHLVQFINGGAGGYANYPTPWSTTPDPGNDVVILGWGLQGKLLAHETGHWLNLIHTFGNVNQTGVCGDDFVLDTPPSAGNMNCDTLQSICNPPVIENINNYMDYSSCGYMFTQGQVTRMQATLLDSTLSRRIIWTPANLTATGVNPVPSCAFNMNIIAYADYGNTCTFTPYYKFIAAPLTQFPDSVRWNFPGGIPTTSDSAVEDVNFSSAATVTVTLNAWRSGVQYTYTVSVTPGIVSNNGLSHSAVFPYTQNFENGFALPHKDLFVTAGDTTWRLNTIGYNSDSALFIPIEQKLQTDTNTFTFGTFSMTNMAHPQLNFKVATSHNSNTVYRKLFVYLKNRCLNTERLISIQYDSVMALNNSTHGFIPSSSTQWKNINVNLSFVNTDSLKKEYEFRFVLIKYFQGTKQDENFYLDNINIADTAGAPPVADFSIENIRFCKGSCYQLECVDHSTGGPSVFSWGTFGGYPNNPIAKGCYALPAMDTVMIYLTVYNEFGSSSVSKPIYIHTIYMDSVSVSPTPLCKGDTATLHFYSWHHSNPYNETYLWTNANTPLTPYNTLVDSSGAIVQAVPLNNTTYNISVVNDFGCTQSFSKSVIVKPTPSAFLTRDKNCIDVNDSVTLSASIGPNYSWSWQPAADLNTSSGMVVHASPDVTTNYTVTITDGVCTDTAQILIKVSPLFPQASIIANDTAFCSGQSLNLFAGGSYNNTWSWTPCCNGSYTVYNDSLHVSFLQTTTVTLTSADSNGCSSNVQQVLVYSPPPSNFWAEPFNTTFAGGNQIILCSMTDSVSLYAVGAANYSYSWYTPTSTAYWTMQNNASINFHNPAFSMAPIYLTATNTEGCSATQQYFINHQFQGNFPTFTVTPSVINICENAMASVNISPGGFGTNYYFWMPTTAVSGINAVGYNGSNAGNGSSATITGTQSMTYTVTAIEVGYGCVASKTVQMNITPAPSVNLGADTTLCSGNTLMLDAGTNGTSYLWNTGTTTQTLPVTVGGVYSVAVTGSNTCFGYDTVSVNFTVCTFDQYTAEEKNYVLVADGRSFSYIALEQGEMQFILFDAAGRCLMSRHSAEGKITLNKNDVQGGIYFIEIRQNSGRRIFRFVLE